MSIKNLVNDFSLRLSCCYAVFGTRRNAYDWLINVARRAWHSRHWFTYIKMTIVRKTRSVQMNFCDCHSYVCNCEYMVQFLFIFRWEVLQKLPKTLPALLTLKYKHQDDNRIRENVACKWGLRSGSNFQEHV